IRRIQPIFCAVDIDWGFGVTVAGGAAPQAALSVAIVIGTASRISRMSALSLTVGAWRLEVTGVAKLSRGDLVGLHGRGSHAVPVNLHADTRSRRHWDRAGRADCDPRLDQVRDEIPLAGGDVARQREVRQ